MKTNTLKWASVALLSAGAFAFTSCSSAPKGEMTTAGAYQKGVPGGVVVRTFKTTATVTGIDADSRKVTLVSPEGRKNTYKAGPEVINFDQIRIGDQLKVTAAEQIVVRLAEQGTPPDAGAAALVALAPKGAKPGGLLANTVEFTAKVTAIDLKHHKVTLQLPDGTTEKFAVRNDVDLTKGKVGQAVVIRTTEALAISVEKP